MEFGVFNPVLYPLLLHNVPNEQTCYQTLPSFIEQTFRN